MLMAVTQFLYLETIVYQLQVSSYRIHYCDLFDRLMY